MTQEKTRNLGVRDRCAPPEGTEVLGSDCTWPLGTKDSAGPEKGCGAEHAEWNTRPRRATRQLLVSGGRISKSVGLRLVLLRGLGQVMESVRKGGRGDR